MTLAKITILALQASIFATVFCLGLEATLQDAVSLFRRPVMLLRSLLSMNVAMPVFAALLAGAFHLNPAVKIALIMLAVSPIPPILPQMQMKAGGGSSYVYGLLVAVSLLSIVTVPVTIEILGKIFSQDAHISPAAVSKVVTMTILLPLGLGIFVHSSAPGFAQRAGKSLARLATALLLVSAVPLFLMAGREMFSLLGNGTLLAIIAFIVFGILAGHFLGRPDPGEQTTLALATASRHPGLAMTIAAANFPAQRKPVAAAILLYIVVRFLLLIPYTRKRRSAEEAPVTKRKAA